MSAAAVSFNSLPEELIVEVFLRLPKKSLLRSRCVSKGLLDLFDSQIFKKRYDIFHYTVTDFAVMILDEDGMFSMDFHLPDNVDSSVEKEVSIPHLNEPTFIGCCKGIVCLMVSPVFDSFILLNPINGTFQNVDCSNLPPVKPWSSIGFGYDYATDDYKIVVLDPVGLGDVHYLSVYSMRRDSWGQVVGEFSPGCSPPHLDRICVEGAIHWFWKNGYHLDGIYTCILAFDLETESLRSLQLPPRIGTRVLLSLKDFGGRLCVLVKPPGGSTIIWVMEEYGNEATWTPLFTIVNGMRYVVGYFPIWDNARLLCFGSDLRSWLWLNAQDGSIEIIQIHKLPCHQGYDVCWYEKQSWVCVRSPLRLPCSVSQND